MILPVLDLLQGQIVRGIAGRRESYRPIVSQLVDGAEPLAVAQALQRHFGFTEFYLADLDAIQQQRPALDIHAQLRREGNRLWIDAGLRTSRDDTLSALLDANASDIIVGLESVAGPDELQRIVQRAGSERTIFSLDMKAGRLLGCANSWKHFDAWSVAEQAIVALEVRRLIVLDLARVGVGEGVGTEELCLRLKRAFPAIQLTTGGGVRGPDDVRQLHEHGVDRVLVASALHDGKFQR